MSAPRIVVVGGGVIGLSVAWRCVRRGATVTVVDGTPGRGASWVAAGMLAPLAEIQPTEPAVVALGLASATRFPAFCAELAADADQDPGYTRTGTLVVARDADDRRDLAELAGRQAAMGLSVESVSGRRARQIEPALSPAVCGALWLADEHQIDNRLLVAALLSACRRAGVGFVPEHAARIDSNEVETASGRIDVADVVVVATGAWRPPFGASCGDARALVPVRPVKGQIIRLQAVASAVCPARTVRGTEVYIVPRAHGEIVVGATSEDVGFDATVTAGAVRSLLTDAWELVPGLSEAHFVEVIAGFRPNPPDNVPIIGSLSGRDSGRLIVATGHSRHGVLLAPITADAVEAMVFDEPVPDVIGACRPDRFVGADRQAALAVGADS